MSNHGGSYWYDKRSLNGILKQSLDINKDYTPYLDTLKEDSQHTYIDIKIDNKYYRINQFSLEVKESPINL
jgi:hypothetical protein